MTELIVIRHGETDWNRRQCFQGQIDVPLNDTGLRQARALAARLAAERIDAIVSSDLQRAHTTALRSAEQLGLQPQVDPSWREQKFGLLEGLELATVQAQHAPLWSQWTRFDPDYELPGGGESVRAFHGRVLRALRAVADAHAGRTVAVFTHGGVLDMLWRTAQGLPLAGPRECDIPNTGINRLRWVDDRLHIDLWGDAAHLAGAAHP